MTTTKNGCLCDFPPDCGGGGVRYCGGCGGDQCVCRCGGEVTCDIFGSCEFCDGAEDGGAFEGLDEAALDAARAALEGE